MAGSPEQEKSGRIKRSFNEFKATQIKGINPDPRRYDARFTRVYFTTISGNVYRLDEHGRLINHNASVQQGQLVGTIIRPELWRSVEIKVGLPVHLPDGGQTTTIKEIVAVEDSRYGSKESKDSIIRRFNDGLPQKIPNLDPAIMESGAVEYESENL